MLHPHGFLDIAQKVAPLGVAIQRFGATTPQTGSIFRITDIQVGGTTIDTAPTREEYAPAQFFAMSDAEKLSRPSFAEYESGVAIGGDAALGADLMRGRDVTYEVIYVPEHHPVRPRFGMPVALSECSAAGGAVAQSPLSRARSARSPLVAAVTLQRDRYAVVSTDDLSLHATELVFDTATEADQALRRLVARAPQLAGAVQVMPAAVLPTAEVFA